MNNFRVDLHVHTVLSPCAQVEMIPPLIVQEAVERGIQVIAITDHNATANIGAVQKAASGSGLIVLAGMEVQTQEEVHSLCLFDTLEQALMFQEYIDLHLPALENRPDFFGEQFVVDETGDFIRREHQLLLVSAEINIREAWEQVQRLGGLFIPAHVNRKAFGLLANLGLVPGDFPVEVLEISRHITPQAAYRQFPQIRDYPLIQNGDVHELESFLGSTEFTIEKPTIAEIRLAISKQAGRSFRVHTEPVLSPGQSSP